MFVFMVTGEHIENAGQTHRRVIIVGVDDSAEAEAAAKWAVREAELRTDDLLLVHAYEAPLLPHQTKTVAIAQGQRQGEALLEKGSWHFDRAGDDPSRPARRG